VASSDDEPRGALAGIKVLDFSTLLPGPLASLILARAGAQVIKIERPGGDEMLRFAPLVDGVGVGYSMLNAGKRVLRVNLKDEADRNHALALAADADVVIEQFRPGVADRLGIGFDAIRSINPSVVYCSITGYGQSGPQRLQAGHDLTFLAEMGFLRNSESGSRDPVLPPMLAADIGAGAFPAVMNILLALMPRDSTREAVHLDVSMSRNLRSFAVNEIAERSGTGQWPEPGSGIMHGATPRYQVYRTADNGHIAVAAMEQHFWDALCELVELPASLRDERGQEAQVIEAVARMFGSRSTSYWSARLAEADTACAVVRTFAESSLEDDLFGPGTSIEATFPVPLDGQLDVPTPPLHSTTDRRATW
jgi:alpha-methylacyl-CoA racemase